MKKTSGGMNKGAVITLLLMVAVGIAFGVGFYFYAQTMRSTIFLFSGDYKAGTQVTKEMFLQQEIDSQTYRGMALNGEKAMYVSSDQLLSYIEKGDKLAADVAAYMPVVDSMFVSTGGTGVERRLDDNKVAVEIPANKVNGLSGNEVDVQSRINVSTFYSMDDIQETDLLFQDLLVLDVVYDADGNLTSIYVELSPEDSIILQHAIVAETVSIAVTKPGSYKQITEGTEYKKSYSYSTMLPGTNAEIYSQETVPSQITSEEVPAAAN